MDNFSKIRHDLLLKMYDMFKLMLCIITAKPKESKEEVTAFFCSSAVLAGLSLGSHDQVYNVIKTNLNLTMTLRG